MKRGWITLFAVLFVIITGIVFFCRNTSTLPLDVENATSIRFSIIPQDDRSYTLTDNNRVKSIVSVINDLDFKDGNKRANRMSDNYYYFRIHIVDKDISIELDENTISVNDDVYQADTTELCALLERSCYDVMQGIIE